MSRTVGVTWCLGLLILCAAAPLRAQIETHPAPPVAATGVLPAGVPVRRDTAQATSTVASWSGSIGFAAFAGGAAGVWWWRRSRARGGREQSAAQAHNVVRLSSQALTPHASVHAVVWNGEELLLGCTAQQVTLLTRRSVRTPGEPA